MTAKTNEPASCELAGLGKSQSETVKQFPCTTGSAKLEDFATVYLARKYRLTPCAARLVAALAGLGGRLA